MTAGVRAGCDAARMHDDDIIVTTTNDLPGYEIEEIYGEVFGLVVRARHAFANLGATFRTIAGGEVRGYTKLLTDSRNDAVERMKAEARELGANAVLAMRFDASSMSSMMGEVAAYGTAARVRRRTSPSA